MRWTATPIDKFSYITGNNQKEIIKYFGLSYSPRSASYKINDDYVLIFLTMKNSNGWINTLNKNGQFIYESHISKDPNKLIIDDDRCVKRITFLKDTSSYISDLYKFIGVFILDLDFVWQNEHYPTGIPMEPCLRYKRIADTFDSTNYSCLDTIKLDNKNITNFKNTQITKNRKQGMGVANMNKNDDNKENIEKLLDKCYESLNRTEFMLLLSIIKEEYK